MSDESKMPADAFHEVDDAIHETHGARDDADAPGESGVRATEPDAREPLLPRMLRGLGAVLLVTAASSFMFRDWGQSDDARRYLMLLGQLALLAASGFWCGLKVRERRGARTFLSIAIAVIPVHFAVLGGVLYSQLALDAPHSTLPAYAIWKAADVATAVGLTLGAMLVIVPATLVSMLTLVRKHAITLGLSFLAGNALLLLPLRNADAMAAVLALAVPVLLWLQLKVFSGTPALETKHGHFVRVAMIAPLAILIGRTVMHYPLNAVFVGVVMAAVGATLFAHATFHRALRERSFAPMLQAVGTGLAICGWMNIGGNTAVQHAVLGEHRHMLALSFFALPCSALLCIAAAAIGDGARPYKRLGAITAALAVGASVLEHHTLITGLLGLAVGVAIAFAATRWQLKGVLALGGATALLGASAIVGLVVHLENLTHWVTLTLVGVALIFAASALDRNRQQLLSRLSGLQGELRGWSY